MLAALVMLASLAGHAASAPLLGVEWGGDFAEIDAWKRSNEPKNASGGAAKVDGSGWPMEDFTIVVFDGRPTYAWAPPEDDPEHHAEWLVGEWQLRFAGDAQVACEVDPNAGCAWKLSAQTKGSDGYTYMNLTMPEEGYKPEKNLLTLNFSDTSRPSGAGAGVVNISFILPNHTFADAPLVVEAEGSAPQFFADWTLKTVDNIGALNHARFMGQLDTNYKTGFYGDTGHHIIEWAQRSLPTDASWRWSPRGNPQSSSVPWEYVIHWANSMKKDVWINVPVAASTGCLPVGGPDCWKNDKGTYVGELAQLLKAELDPERKIYIEHSNEVWNFGFTQYVWNKLNADDMCTQTHGSDPMCKIPCGKNPGPCTNEQVYSERRHAQRLYEIANGFAEVFGEEELGKRILPVYASWTIQPQSYYNDTLAWLEQAYGKGTVSKYFSFVAGTAYFPFNTTAGPGKFNKSLPLPPDASVKQIVDGFMSGATTVPDAQAEIAAVGKVYGLKMASYEGGPGFKVGGKTDLSNLILSQRDPGMNPVMKAWWSNYGQIYDILHEFTLAGLYSRYGSWGSADLLSLASRKDKEVPKYIALTEL